MAAALTGRSLWGKRCFLLQHKLNTCFTISVADFTWFIVLLRSGQLPFSFSSGKSRDRIRLAFGRGEGRALVLEEGRPLAGPGCLVQFNTHPLLPAGVGSAPAP